MRFRGFYALLSAILIIQTSAPFPVFAQTVDLDAGFDPNHVLEDADIFDANSMSYDGLVAFLRNKGTLADYRTADIDGVPKTAAEIIWRVAHTYKMNPKYLLALIQKEQSLVEDPNPSQRQFDWAAGYAVCDSCSKDDPSIQEFKGFASQLEWAAKQHREKYLLQILTSGTTKSGKAAGKAMTVDGLSVTPVNNATAMLYSYTPHLHGNLSLWRIWRRWFSIKFPDGTIVSDKASGKTYLVRFGIKRAFASHAVLESLVDPDKIIQASATELSTYADGPEIRFPKYALLKDPEGRIWLLTENAKRHITNMAAFHKFGFNEDEVEDVTDADLTDYPEGLKISEKTEFPQGVVFQDATSKAYWYIEDTVRHQIPSPVFLSLYFKGRNIKQLTIKKLAVYKVGDAYRLHEGELVRGVKSSAVFVVENGALRPIPSAYVFESLGWQWKNVITVPDSVLKPYTIGVPFTLESMEAPIDMTTLVQASQSTTSTTAL